MRLTVPFTAINSQAELKTLEPGAVFLLESVDERGQSITLVSRGEQIPGWLVSDMHTNALRFLTDSEILSVSKSPFNGLTIVVRSDGGSYHGLNHFPTSQPVEPPTERPRLRVR